MADNAFYDKEHGILFQKLDNGFFEPIGYNGNIEEGLSIEEIVKGSVLHDFILFVKFSTSITDKRTGEIKKGYLDIFQWVIAIKVIMSAVNLDSSEVACTIARQSGKSHISRVIIAFCTVFVAQHIFIEEDRYYMTFTSFKADTASDQLDKLTPFLHKAIELFNELYPSQPLEWKEKMITKTILKKNSSKIEINKVINGESISYSSIDILSMNKNVMNPGYTSHFMFFDESQDVDMEAYLDVKPFRNRTGGVIYTIGTSSNSNECLLYNMYISKNIPENLKIIMNWETIRKYKELVSKKHAEKYSRSILKDIDEYGLYSSYIQTEYMCNFNLTNDKFTSMEFLKDNNILTGDVESNISQHTRNDTYRIGAIDPALKNDRFPMVLGLAKVYEGRNETRLTEAIVIKEAGTSANPDDLIKRVVDTCVTNKLDFLIVDDTGTQEFFTHSIYTELKKVTNTQIVPFKFSANEKSKMFAHIENILHNQSYQLPVEEFRKQNRGYDYLLKEICALKRYKKVNGEYSYKAPNTASSYDDFAMAFAMLGYCIHYVQTCVKTRKQIQLGAVKYRLYLKKNTDVSENDNKFPTNYITTL